MQRFWYQRMITKADQGLLDELFKGAKGKEESNLKTLKEVEARETELARVEANALKVCSHPNIRVCRPVLCSDRNLC